MCLSNTPRISKNNNVLKRIAFSIFLLERDVITLASEIARIIKRQRYMERYMVRYMAKDEFTLSLSMPHANLLHELRR